LNRIEVVDAMPSSSPDRRMSARIVISRTRRDALYAELLTALSQFPDLDTLSVSGQPEDIEECERIGRRLGEALRLIQDGGLGWGCPQSDESVELTLPPDELRRIMAEQRRRLVVHLEANRADREQTESEWRQAEEARAACTAVLEQIGAVAS
jgi:hypothetical protein